ncbi:MAG TPA: O-methyltransferase [Gemmatimonadaceae bacterium]|jgi:predicted O-methyltransferase YrrM|nr:O-methyltransferase [Gemmatimonadaceae bacterium]
MAEPLWTDVERYVNDLVVRPDAVLDAALEAASAAGLPAISVSAGEGKLLYLLARIRRANRILEIGTLAAYSTIWMARALPRGGKLVTLESDPTHAAVARANLARAELGDVVDLRLGMAADTLPVLAAEGQKFDLIFIDADKQTIPHYFDWAMRLSNPGALIIVDNVIRDGKVIDETSEDASVRGVRRFNEMVSAEKRVSATTIQTVGSKGYDGFTLLVVK